MNKFLIFLLLLLIGSSCDSRIPSVEIVASTPIKADTTPIPIKDTVQLAYEKKFHKMPFNISSDSLNIKDVTFNNKTIWTDMSLQQFLKFYPKAILKKEKVYYYEINEEIEHRNYYISSKSYGFFDGGEKTGTLNTIHINDDKGFLDFCPEAKVGSDISTLKKCFPNSYKKTAWVLDLTEEERKGKYSALAQELEILFVKINYPAEEATPFNILYTWNTKTRKIVSIQTNYEGF